MIDDPVVVAVAAVALLVAGAAMWLHVPAALALDSERWFKTMLATVLRGSVDAEGGDVTAWEAAVARFVPFHPLCRDADRLLGSPETGVPPGPTRPGERLLVDALAALPPGRARWDRLFGTPESFDAVRGDPFDLGAAYDPAARFGPAAGWDALAAWGSGDPAFAEALFRRVPATWVLVDGAGPGPTLIPALAAALGARATTLTIDPADVPAAVTALTAAIDAAAPDASSRWIAIVAGEAAPILLRALHGAPGLRDRLLVAVTIGGVVRGWPDRDGPLGEVAMREWLDSAFRHEQMDTERSRATPYLSLEWCDPDAPTPAAGGLRVVAQRLPEPAGGLSVSTIATMDLGVLPNVPDLPVAAVARALIATVVAVAVAADG